MIEARLGRVACALGCAAAAFVACSSGGSGGSLSAIGIDDGASRGEVDTALVERDQAATLRLSTGAELRIPAGALDRSVEIRLERPEDARALKLTETLDEPRSIRSAPYVVTPHGTRFERDVELTLPIAPDARLDALRVARLDDEDDRTWEMLEARPEIREREVRIQVDHFSVFVVVESAAPAVDASVDAGGGDASTDAGDAGMGVAQTTADRALQQLQACGLVGQEGALSLAEPDHEVDACTVECVLNAACPDFTAFICQTGGESAALVDCVRNCGGVVDEFDPTFCADGSGATRCDGEVQCSDGADETGCPPASRFECGDGSIVPPHFECDGIQDCSDNSDEAACPADAYFQCADGTLTNARWACDGEPDCSDGSDESECAGLLFTCASGDQQVSLDSVCDLEDDCVDGSDEAESQGCLVLACPPAP